MRETEIRSLFADSAQDIRTSIPNSDDLLRRGRVARRRRARNAGLGAIACASALVLGITVPIMVWTGDGNGTPAANDQVPTQTEVPVLSKGNWSSTGLVEESRLDAELGVDSSNCLFVLRDGRVYDVMWPQDYGARMNERGTSVLIVGPDDQVVAAEGKRFSAAGGQMRGDNIDLECSADGTQGVVGVFRVG